MSLGSSNDAPPKADQPLTTRDTNASLKLTLSDDLESAVDEIRAGKSWIHKIVDRRKLEETDAPQQDEIDDAFLPVATECIVQPRPRECSEADNISDSGETARSLDDAIHLQKFGRHRDRQHIYPIDIGRGSSEARSLQPEHSASRDCCCMLTASTGLVWQMLAPSAAVLFSISVYLQLRQRRDAPFALHATLMNAMLVLMTVTTAFLQRSANASSQSRTQLRLQSQGLFSASRLHVLAQLGAAVACVSGMAVCLTERKAPMLDAKNNMMHRIAGHIAVLLFFAQLCLRACSLLFSSKDTGDWRHSAIRFWHRYRRMLGCANVVFVWISAWLGIHTSWSKSLERKETRQTLGHSEFYWICLFAAFMTGLLASKFAKKTLCN